MSTEQLTLDRARQLALEHIKAGRISEAECFTNAILAKFPNDSLANFAHGLIAFHHGHHSYAITLFRNALRVDPHHSGARDALEHAIRTMNSSNPHDICVVGDSHTGVFRLIKDVTVFWTGPVTMRRLGKEGEKFLNYNNFGIKPGSFIVSIFGEIDIRTHFMRLCDGSERSIARTADAIVSRYLLALSNASKTFGVRRQIVGSIVPPFRGGVEVNQESAGTVQQRIAATIAVNDRLRFGSSLLGFSFLDLYTPFVDGVGTLDRRFTEDGIHIHSDYAAIVAEVLRKVI